MKVSGAARYYRDHLERKLRRLHRRSFGDDGVAISSDMEVDSDTLLVTFGGMKSLAGLASYEFVAMTEAMPVKKMYLRDPRQSWYHRGMPQQGTTLEGVAAAVGKLLEQQDLARTVLAGNSAGGYAALLFGEMLGVDTVLAFAPQTVIHPQGLAAMGDRRWDEMLAPLIKHDALEQRWADLREALPGIRHSHVQHHVYYDITNTLDRQHAEHLRGLDGVHLYRFAHGGHGLVRELRDSGALDRLLRRHLGLPELDPAAVRVDAEPSKHATLDFKAHR
jgi:hypothetical protein